MSIQLSSFWKILLLSLLPASHLDAQQKFFSEVNIAFNNSIGSNKLVDYTTPDDVTGHYQRKRYENPYVGLNAEFLYQPTSCFSIGLRSGITLHISEQYVSVAKRTTVSIPLQLSGNAKIADIGHNSIGLSIASGFSFFNIYDRIESYKNGKLLGAYLYYLTKNKNIFRLGLEKQIDNATIYVYKIDQYSIVKVFDYKLNRLSLSISYGHRF